MYVYVHVVAGAVGKASLPITTVADRRHDA